MSVIPLVIDVVTVCFLVACMHYHYGNWRKHHIIVTVATFLSWFLPFMIVFVLPIDVSSTCHNQCIKDDEMAMTTSIFTSVETRSASGITTTENMTHALFGNKDDDVQTASLGTGASTDQTYMPTYRPSDCREPPSYVSAEALSILWHVVYWTSQSLTWVILPVMQSYSKAGEFTVLGKMKYALIANAIYYGTYLLIFGICLIYVAAQPDLHFDASQLKVLAITASNTWGLSLLVLLLGYGLVEVPRLCWNNSKRDYSLSRIHFKIAKMSLEKIEAEEALEDAIAEVKRVNEAINATHPYRPFVDTIIRKCPESLQLTLTAPSSSTRRNRDDFLGAIGSSSDYDLSQSFLVKLHRRVIVSVQRHDSTQCQWNKMLETAIYLEDISRNRISTGRVFVRSPDVGGCSIWNWCRCPKFEWYWKCWMAPFSLKILAILMALLTLMIMWSECLFFIVKPVLSLFAIFLNLARSYHYNYIAIEFVCVLTISYLSVCTYYTVFKMRIFNYYVVVGDHHTNENSLIFCGMMLCRLTPPLCLNFLGLMHLDSHITSEPGIVETSYTKFMGHMDVISFISDGFNIYFPIAIVLLCVLTWFNVGQRVLHLLGFQQFIGDDEMTQELIDEGSQLVGRELRKRQRQEESDARRRTWQDRYSDRVGAPYDQYADRGNTVSDLDETSRRRMGRVINETDRSELLQEAEPIDYSGSRSAGNIANHPSTGPTDFTSGLYQAGGASPRTLHGRDWSVLPPSNQGAGYNPPRRIFDDI